MGPDKKIILSGTKERQGDFVFTANHVGDFEFCFSNQMSTVTDKVIDFEIAVNIQIRFSEFNMLTIDGG